MRPPGTTPLNRLRSLHWLRRMALPLFVAMFLAAGLAHVSHLHKADAGSVAAENCGLCVQFERLAGAPVVVVEPAASVPCVRIRVVTPALRGCAPFASAYLARGPPAV